MGWCDVEGLDAAVLEGHQVAELASTFRNTTSSRRQLRTALMYWVADARQAAAAGAGGACAAEAARCATGPRPPTQGPSTTPLPTFPRSLEVSDTGTALGLRP